MQLSMRKFVRTNLNIRVRENVSNLNFLESNMQDRRYDNLKKQGPQMKIY